MKNSKKGIAPILILLIGAVIIAGGFAAFKMNAKSKSGSPAMTSESNNSVTTTQTTPMPSPSGAMTNNTSTVKGNTNADLNTDLQTIGGKVNSENSVSTDVDTSFQNQSQDTSNIQ